MAAVSFDVLEGTFILISNSDRFLDYCDTEEEHLCYP